MSTVNFDHLFAPLQVGPMLVPNRICETTNTINSSMTPGMIDEHFIAHHLAKAKGGTGWIGSETWLLNVPFPPETPDEVGCRASSISMRPSLLSTSDGSPSVRISISFL